MKIIFIFGTLANDSVANAFHKCYPGAYWSVSIRSDKKTSYAII